MDGLVGVVADLAGPRLGGPQHLPLVPHLVAALARTNPGARPVGLVAALAARVPRQPELLRFMAALAALGRVLLRSVADVALDTLRRAFQRRVVRSDAALVAPGAVPGAHRGFAVRRMTRLAVLSRMNSDERRLARPISCLSAPRPLPLSGMTAEAAPRCRGRRVEVMAGQTLFCVITGGGPVDSRRVLLVTAEAALSLGEHLGALDPVAVRADRRLLSIQVGQVERTLQGLGLLGGRLLTGVSARRRAYLWGAAPAETREQASDGERSLHRRTATLFGQAGRKFKRACRGDAC